MASLLDVLIFDAVYGSWILSLPLFTLAIMLKLLLQEELLHSVRSAKHEHSRGVWGHAPTGKF